MAPSSRQSTPARETSAFLSRLARAGGIIDISRPARYAIAIAAAVLAILVRLALDPVLGVRFPYITLFPAIMLSAWLGGLGPGVVATLLSGVAAVYFWNAPEPSWAVTEKGELIGVVLFVAVGATISLLNEVWRRAASLVAHSEERLTTTLRSIGDGVIRRMKEVA
jgi:K+-sensing histidine kinase KdpD